MTTAPPPAPVAVLSGGKTTSIAQARPDGDDLWLTLADLAAATGWELKPEGMCRDEVCIPLSPDEEAAMVSEETGTTWVNLTAFARYTGQPFAHDGARGAWSFGPPAYEWQSRLGNTDAPDFTLSDFQGNLHSLSDYRGKKVFLVTWASW